MLDELDGPQRLNLLKFVCSFAWADLEIRPSERRFVSGLVGRLGLGEAEARKVQQWLDAPPMEEELDPHLIPLRHRELFLETVREVIRVDGEIADEEREHLELLEELLSIRADAESTI